MYVSVNNMEQRLTLVSDPTPAFPHNTNNSFKVRIADGLRLEGKGWYVSLLSLTLPNSDSHSDPFVTGHDKTVAKASWQLLHFQGPSNGLLNDLTRHGYTTDIKENHVKKASSGVAYWNSVIQAIEEDVMTLSLSLSPSFRWEGEDLMIEKRGDDSTNEQQVNTVLYSSFDIAYEVALQWGFIEAVSDTKVKAGPNLRIGLFQEGITWTMPQREIDLGLKGVDTLIGKAFRAPKNLDMPRSIHVAASGSTLYDAMWYYTVSNQKWIRLSGGVEWRLTNLNATYDAIHLHSGKVVMVYTNLQQSTIVGSTKAQLLCQLVVRRGGEKGHTYSEPKHLEWIPVSTHQTNIVEVQLADVDGNLLKLPKGKSLATVAIKQMV